MAFIEKVLLPCITFRKRLKKNDYLKGMEALFIKHGLTEVYGNRYFTDKPSKWIILYVLVERRNKEMEDEIRDYLKQSYLATLEESAREDGPGIILGLVRIEFRREKLRGKCIYRDGTFYSREPVFWMRWLRRRRRGGLRIIKRWGYIPSSDCEDPDEHSYLYPYKKEAGEENYTAGRM